MYKIIDSSDLKSQTNYKNKSALREVENMEFDDDYHDKNDSVSIVDSVIYLKISFLKEIEKS